MLSRSSRVLRRVEFPKVDHSRVEKAVSVFFGSLGLNYKDPELFLGKTPEFNETFSKLSPEEIALVNRQVQQELPAHLLNRFRTDLNNIHRKLNSAWGITKEVEKGKKNPNDVFLDNLNKYLELYKEKLAKFEIKNLPLWLSIPKEVIEKVRSSNLLTEEEQKALCDLESIQREYNDWLVPRRMQSALSFYPIMHQGENFEKYFEEKCDGIEIRKNHVQNFLSLLKEFKPEYLEKHHDLLDAAYKFMCNKAGVEYNLEDIAWENIEKSGKSPDSCFFAVKSNQLKVEEIIK